MANHPSARTTQLWPKWKDEIRRLSFICPIYNSLYRRCASGVTRGRNTKIWDTYFHSVCIHNKYFAIIVSLVGSLVGSKVFRSGREFAAWLGMTPRQNSSGGKERLGRTSKRGDKYIRSLLTAGAVAVLRHARNRSTGDGEWVRALLARDRQTNAASCPRRSRQRRL
jgi:Transposase IS116/IS110/IS902 family